MFSLKSSKKVKIVRGLNGTLTDSQTTQELQAVYLEVLDNSPTRQTGSLATDSPANAVVERGHIPTPPVPIPVPPGSYYMKLIPSGIEHHLYTTTSRNSGTVPLLQAEDKRMSKENEEEEVELDEAERELYESIRFDGDYVEPNPVRPEQRTDRKPNTRIYMNT